MNDRQDRTMRLLFAFSLIGLGLVGLAAPGPLGGWMPIPVWLPFEEALASIMGAMLVVMGFAFAVLDNMRRPLEALAGLMMAWIVILHPTRLYQAHFSLGALLGVAEVGSVAAAAWLASAHNYYPGRAVAARAYWPGRLAVLAFATALVVFGLCHFAYLDVTTAMVPTWLPVRQQLAIITGAAHIAAGLSLIARRYEAWAMRLLTAMFVSFDLLVHVPRISADVFDRTNWLLLFTSMLMTAAAWTMAVLCDAKRSRREPKAS